MNKKILAIVMSIVLMVTLNVSSVAGAKTSYKSVAVKILSASNISKTIIQNSKFTLPKTVNVKLSNNKTSNVAVKWNKSAIKTNVPGTFKFIGKIKGYAKNINLTLVIKPLPVVKNIPKIKVIVVPESAEINQNDPYTLPKTVVAEMSDGSRVDLDIKWNVDSDTVKTDVPGEFTFVGKVKDNPDEIMIKLIIKPLVVEVKKPVIVSIEKPAIMSAKENETKVLPSTVVAVMDDGTKSDVSVKWNKSGEELKRGLNTLEGTVEGSSNKAKLYFVVRGQDLSAPEQITGVEAKPGDIVGVKSSFDAMGKKFPYEHYGIFIGNGQVIEFISPITGKMKDAKITLSPMSRSFSNYFILKLKDTDIKYKPEEIVQRAKEAEARGDGNYDLIGNNCEHFAVWCQTGIYKSFQSDSYPLDFVETAVPLLDLINLNF